MKKFPSIDRIGHESTAGIFNKRVTILEKVDGANFRFTMGKNVDGAPDDKLVFGTKNAVYKNEKDIDTNFLHAVEYVRNQIPNTHPDWWSEHVKRKNDQLTLFGEAMHAHTLEYGEPEQQEHGAPTWKDVPNVLLFEVYSEQEGWLPWPSVKAVARRVNIPTVAAYDEGRDVHDPEEIAIDWESHYRDGVAEGVVIRAGSGSAMQRAKYRTEEFLDQHGGGAKQGDPQAVDDDTYQLANKLLRQEPWVEKWIHRYENQGREIEMSIMEDLWRDVFDDIIEEEYETILLGNWDINTKQFRSHIADHTAKQLRAYLNRPQGSALNDSPKQT